MKEYGFGIDLGGTTCKIGLFKTTGELVEKWEIPTNTDNDGENILKDIAGAIHGKMIEKDITKDMVEGAGIGVPGPIMKDGSVNRCVNLGWGVKPIEKELSELLGFNVKAGNDANVAALGEAWKGAGQGYDSIVMVTLGTGIGGGIILDGKILGGEHGAAGEIGHITVNKQEIEACGCGRYGCIEQYASATGIVRMAKRHLKSTSDPSSLRDLDLDKLEAKDVFDAAKAGDEEAKEIVSDSSKLLAQMLASVSEVVDPQAFVIGGGVSKAGQILVDNIAKEFKDAVFHACKDINIKLATLGNDAGMYGAVKMIL